LADPAGRRTVYACLPAQASHGGGRKRCDLLEMIGI